MNQSRSTSTRTSLFATFFMAIALGGALGNPLSGTAEAAISPEFFGSNIQAVFADGPATAERHLAAMEANGVKTLRLEVSWWHVERRPPDASTGVHSFDWTGYDSHVAAIARHHLRSYMLIDYSSSWGGDTPGDPFSAPQLAPYTAFAKAVATRYGRGGEFWNAHPELPYLPATHFEIWNEPNLPHFWRDQSNAPERYADLYLSARSAIRSVDGGAVVVTAGLSPGGATDFVARMSAARPDLRGNVDAFGYHPYGNTVDEIFELIREMRLVVDRELGPAIPIEVTEVGWPYSGWGDPTEAERAARLSQLTRDLPYSDCGVTRLMPHTWVDRAGAVAADSFGIFKLDGSGPEIPGVAYFEAIADVMAGLETGRRAPSGRNTSAPEAPSSAPPSAPFVTPNPASPRPGGAGSESRAGLKGTKAHVAVRRSSLRFLTTSILPSRGMLSQSVTLAASGRPKLVCQSRKSIPRRARYETICSGGPWLRRLLRARGLQIQITHRFEALGGAVATKRVNRYITRR
jgi:hypothetical protein